MAQVPGSGQDVSKQLADIFNKMGDLHGASVTVYNTDSDVGANMKSARLLEVFDISRNGKREITILTADLGQDTDEHEKLFGSRPGTAVKKGLLQERFPVTEPAQKYIRNTELPELAEKMIAESPLDGNMKLGLKAIVNEKLAAKAVTMADGVASLRSLVNQYLQRPMTAEWQNELIAKSPLTIAVRRLSEGCGTALIAPEKATFAKKQPVTRTL